MPLSFNKVVAPVTRRRRSTAEEREDEDEAACFSLPIWLRLPFFKTFNFILFHYIYLIAFTLVGSIMIYPAGQLDYIDALFHASGAATQSGLNTIDINQLHLYQQIVLILISFLCNPITINTFVVFLRLYWFEKRFQHIVKEARTFRRTRTRSIGKGDDHKTGNMAIERAERGVGGREIKVLKETGATTKKSPGNDDDDVAVESDQESMATGENTNGKPTKTPTNPGDVVTPSTPFSRNIVFADELVQTPKALSNEDRVPGQRSKEEHIAFVENQRNPKDKATLRIPGPREVERGYVPERVEDDLVSRPSPAVRRQSDAQSEYDPDSPHETRGRRRLSFGNSSNRLRNRLNSFHLPNFRSSSPKSIGARAKSFGSIVGRTFSQAKEDSDPQPYLSYAATIGRNSTFVNLTEEQREELGGVEYRSLKTLAWVLLVYNFGLTLFGIVLLLPWIVRSAKFRPVVEAAGQSPVWWGFFTPMSMFTDLGFTLTPDSMVSFNTAVMPMLLGTFLIIAGNTGFPCLLRFVIWVGTKILPSGSGVWEEFRFLLDHPRRCFTLLFPRKATWWLFLVLIALNGIDLIFFVLLDLKDTTVTSLPPGFQFLDGLFQAASTRTAGFACVNLADLHPGIQVSYLIMMYISVLPIAISVRQTNVYEEKSLGIYGHEDHTEWEEEAEGARSYLGSHLRMQLSFDLWYVFLGLFFITIIEGGRIEDNNQPGFTIFSILFEIVSAYGTVGLSLGYPGVNTSFSGQFKVLSKLIIVAMMLRGRHRGLPYALDRAILLPGEGLKKDKLRNKEKSSNGGVLEGVDTGTAVAKVDSPMQKGRARSRSRVGTQLQKIVSGAMTAGPVRKEKRI